MRQRQRRLLSTLLFSVIAPFRSRCSCSAVSLQLKRIRTAEPASPVFKLSSFSSGGDVRERHVSTILTKDWSPNIQDPSPRSKVKETLLLLIRSHRRELLLWLSCEQQMELGSDGLDGHVFSHVFSRVGVTSAPDSHLGSKTAGSSALFPLKMFHTWQESAGKQRAYQSTGY